MTAPTEAEVRDLVAQTGHLDPTEPVADLAHLIRQWSAPLNSAAWEALEATDPRDPESSMTALWADLRVSEAVVLDRAVAAAQARALDRCIEVIVDELTAAGLRFAAEHPDAPRAREAVPA